MRVHKTELGNLEWMEQLDENLRQAQAKAFILLTDDFDPPPEKIRGLDPKTIALATAEVLIRDYGYGPIAIGTGTPKPTNYESKWCKYCLVFTDPNNDKQSCAFVPTDLANGTQPVLVTGGSRKELGQRLGNRTFTMWCMPKKIAAPKRWGKTIPNAVFVSNEKIGDHGEIVFAGGDSIAGLPFSQDLPALPEGTRRRIRDEVREILQLPPRETGS